MARPFAATHGFSLTIPADLVNGPFSLSETILSGQTSKPEWVGNDGGFTDVEVLDDTPIKYTLSHVGDADIFSLDVQAIACDESSQSEEISANLKNHVMKVLGLRDDLKFFYRKFSEEDRVLSETFRNLRGLRLMCGTDPFRTLICSILSQNNSVRLWNRSARLMMKHYGRMVNFMDGSHEFLFPTPETLARLNPRELKSRTSMGYRAKPVVTVSRMVVNGEFDPSRLAHESYENAKAMLLELPGVGPKVADCFLLYGAGRQDAAPVDVWIHRIVSKLYLRGRKASRAQTSAFLRERFRDWAGYAQLYLFDYARRKKFWRSGRIKRVNG